MRQIAEQLTQAYQQNRKAGDLTKVCGEDAGRCAIRGTPACAWSAAHWDPQQRYYLVRSAGPDKRFDTADDLSTMLEVRTRKIAGPPDVRRSSIDLQIEHDRGPFNGRAEIVGSVTDPTGAAVAGADVTAREAATGATRTATTNAAGQFTLAGLAAGDYQVQVSVAGLQDRVARR